MAFRAPDMAPPVADKQPTARTIHGTELVDEYAWIRADNWQEVMRDPSVLADDIRAHLEAENAYAEAALAPLQDHKKTLVAEMRGRIKEDDVSVPAPDGPYAYGTRFRDGGQHPVYVRTPRDGGDEGLQRGLRHLDHAPLLGGHVAGHEHLGDSEAIVPRL